MRVLILTGEYPPMRGGIGDYTHLLAQTLRSEGVDVRVLCRNSKPTEPDGVPTERIIRSWSWGSWPLILDAVRRLCPDWVHIQYNHSIFDDRLAIHLLPWRLRLLRSRPQIAITFHDLNVPYLFRKAGPARSAVLSLMALGCDAVVTSNEQDWDRLQYLRCAGRVLVRIPVGSNIPVQAPPGYDRTAWRARIGLLDEDFLIVRFGPVWEFETLVEAFCLLVHNNCPAHLLVLGRSIFESWHKAEKELGDCLTRRLGKRGLDGRVHRTGYLPATEVSGWLAAADVAGLHYLDGPCFRHASMLAALGHGLPVVTTESNVLDPGLEHGRSVYLVPPNDPVELARALQLLFQDKALRNRLSEGARRLAKSFTWDVILQQHIDLYEEIH